MVSEYKKKNKNLNSLDINDNYESYKGTNAFSLSNKSDNHVWWSSNKEKNYHRNYDLKTEEVLKNDPNISSITKPGGKKLRDIPNQMGYFETKSVGTVSVGFDRYDKKSDLGFTVVSKKDKNNYGIPERDEYDPNTFFGGNFDGKEKDFKAGEISFRYDRKREEIDKIEKSKSESAIDDEDNLLYQDEKEEYKLEKLKKQKIKMPYMAHHFRREEENLKEIENKKRKENYYFLKEIETFINDLKDGKIKMMIEADEVAKRRRRIIELSNDIIILERIRKRLKELLGKDDVEDLLAIILVKTKLRNMDEKELLKIVNNVKK